MGSVLIRPQWKVFSSFPFAAALVLLLLNDFLLKTIYGNWLTGKLSDFAGVLLLALFMGAFFPTRILLCCLSSALCLVVWKSPLAEPVLHVLNRLSPATFGRVPDCSDLLALAVLPFAAPCLKYADRLQWPIPSRRVVTVSMLALSVFALAATSARYRPHDLEVGYGSSPNGPTPSGDVILAAIDEFLVRQGFVRERIKPDISYYRRSSADYRSGITSVAVAVTPDQVRVSISIMVGGFGAPKAPARELRRDIREHLEKTFPGLDVDISGERWGES